MQDWGHHFPTPLVLRSGLSIGGVSSKWVGNRFNGLSWTADIAVYSVHADSLVPVHLRMYSKKLFLKDPLSVKSVIFAGQLFQSNAPFMWVVVMPVFKKVLLGDRFSSSLLWRHNGRDGVSSHSTVYSGPEQRKNQSFASLAFVRGIHRSPVNSPHKGPVTRKMFPFDDVIMIPQLITLCLALHLKYFLNGLIGVSLRQRNTDTSEYSSCICFTCNMRFSWCNSLVLYIYSLFVRSFSKLFCCTLSFDIKIP